MSFPEDIGSIDLCMGLPAESWEHPAGYMFGDPTIGFKEGEDPIEFTIERMDRFNIDLGLLVLAEGADTNHGVQPLEVVERALREAPDRFIGCVEVDPNRPTEAVRAIRKAHDELGVKAVGTTPGYCEPGVAINDAKYYPVYQACIDLDLPIFVNAGVMGPLKPSVELMYPGHFDQVCYDFPELRVIIRHGAEPWEELAVKLMLKWEGLHFCTSAFAPKYWPRAVIDFANTRGTSKVMYAGYYPVAISFERSFAEMPDVPFRDKVWQPFLRDNAIRLLKLEDHPRIAAAAAGREAS